MELVERIRRLAIVYDENAKANEEIGETQKANAYAMCSESLIEALNVCTINGSPIENQKFER